MLIDAPLTEVFGVLSDPHSYADWVVGSREIRHADEHWPGAGARLGHTVGRPPLVIRDQTVVVESDPPVGITLRVQARPLPSATVSFQLQPSDGGTRVTMVEDLASPMLNLLAGPVWHAAMRIRNRETLRRRKDLAER